MHSSEQLYAEHVLSGELSRLRTTSFVRYRLTTIDGFAQHVRNQLV